MLKIAGLFVTPVSHFFRDATLQVAVFDHSAAQIIEPTNSDHIWQVPTTRSFPPPFRELAPLLDHWYALGFPGFGGVRAQLTDR